MQYLQNLIEVILHLNVHLQALVNHIGLWSYAIIFVIIFCETGLVVTPFLPGDSLLFAAGSIAAISSLNPHLLVILIILAAFLGDNCNYWIGRWMGPRVFTADARFFKTHYLEKTQAFYQKHGPLAIILARYVPLLRTFVPFVAGIGQMKYRRYLIFSLAAAMIWATLLIYLGFFFGNIPWVKENFSIAIMLVIIASISPAIIKALHFAWVKRKLQ